MSSEKLAADGDNFRNRFALMRQLAAPVGLGLAAITVRVQQLIAIQEIRESRAYRGEGLTWDQYCTEILGDPAHKVEEALLSAAELGAKMFAVAEWAGLKRADFRQLRRGNTGEIRLLEESNEIVFGDEVITVAAENKSKITEAFLELLQREQKEKDAVAEKLADAEATIAKGRTQLEAKEEELEEKDNQIRVAASILAVMRHDHPLQAAADAIEVRLAELIQQMRDDEFDKAEAIRIHRRLSERVTDLARYAHGATLDPSAAFQRLSPEMQEIVRANDAEHELDPYFEELGNEEEVDDA
jgi:hypothetical protein